MTTQFELFKKLLATLMLVGVMTVFVTGCSSSDDPVEDEASGSAPTDQEGEGLEDCGRYTNQVDIAECEVRNEMRSN